MSKYIIVSKSPKGNKTNCAHIVQYQVEGFDTEIFETQLFYLSSPTEGEPRYVYFGDKMGKHLDTNEDRDEFLVEFAKYQKGGSYRKTHPIKLSKSMQLRARQKQLRDELSQLDHDIIQADEEERQEKFKTYKNDIDYTSLNKYLDEVATAIKSDRYYLNPVMHIWDGYKIEVIDKVLNKPVYIGELGKNGIKFRDIDAYEIK